jgi:hypothetical protein
MSVVGEQRVIDRIASIDQVARGMTAKLRRDLFASTGADFIGTDFGPLNDVLAGLETDMGTLDDDVAALQLTVANHTTSIATNTTDIGLRAFEVDTFADIATTTIPAGYNAVRTRRYSTANNFGGASYVYDAAADAAYVTAHPRCAKISANGRGFRLNERVIDVRMTGALVDGVTDDIIAINGALAYPYSTIVEFPAGTSMIAKSVQMRSGTTVRGQGMAVSIIKVMTTFDKNAIANGAIFTPTGVSNVVVEALTLEMNKVYHSGVVHPNNRLVGVFMNGPNGFLVRDVLVKNCTAYAFHCAKTVTAVKPTRGFFINCYSENANVHFEIQDGYYINYVNCHSKDGDGDIGCEAHFHIQSISGTYGSYGVKYISCTATGSGSMVNLVTAGAPMKDIEFHGCDFDRTLGDATCAIFAGPQAIDFKMFGGRVTSFEGSALSTTAVTTGSAIGTYFAGRSSVIGVVALLVLSTSFSFINCTVYALTTAAGAGAYALSAGSGVRFIGCHGIAESTGGGGAAFPLSGTCYVDESTTFNIPWGNWQVQGTTNLVADGLDAYADITIPAYTALPNLGFDEMTFRTDASVYSSGLSWSWQATSTTNVRVRLKSGAGYAGGVLKVVYRVREHPYRGV